MIERARETAPSLVDLIKGARARADNGNVSFDLTERTRLIALVAVLALAAGGAGVLLIGRGHGSTGKSAIPPSMLKGGTKHAPTPVPARPVTAAGSGLPAAIASQLAAGRVVVVSLYAPKATIDATAMREAAAGAGIAGAGFVAVDVNGTDVDALNKRYGVVQDPAVLVLRPPGDLIVRIDGFADRDTVAQAASNAGS